MSRVLILCLALGLLTLSGWGEPLRDPFWPVGYKPDGTDFIGEEDSPLNFDDLTPEEQALIRAHMNVSGVLKQSGSFFAFINGMVVKEGDIVPLNVGSKNYRFRIREISNNTINLEPLREKSVNQQPKQTTGEK